MLVPPYLIDSMRISQRTWTQERSRLRLSGQEVGFIDFAQLRHRLNEYISLLKECIREGYKHTPSEEEHIRTWEAGMRKSTEELYAALPAFKPGIKVKFDSDDEEPAPAPVPLPMQGGTANSRVLRRSTATGKKAERKRVCKEAPLSSERKRPRDDSSADEDGWHTVKR